MGIRITETIPSGSPRPMRYFVQRVSRCRNPAWHRLQFLQKLFANDMEHVPGFVRQLHCQSCSRHKVTVRHYCFSFVCAINSTYAANEMHACGPGEGRVAQIMRFCPREQVDQTASRHVTAFGPSVMITGHLAVLAITALHRLVPFAVFLLLTIY